MVAQYLLCILLPTLLGYRGWKKKSLSKSGALAAAVTGSVHLLCGVRFGVTLVAFYLSSSKLTKLKADVKRKVEEGYKEGGQRNAYQVAANSLCACVLALCYVMFTPHQEVLDSSENRLAILLLAGFLGHYACCCGDTWASEIGVLATSAPRLVTTGRSVERGTNGGVTLLGTGASALGGTFMGLCFWLAGLGQGGKWNAITAPNQWKLVPLGLGLGVVGSLLDSLLGAVCQYSGYCSVRGKVVETPGPNVRHITGYPLLSNCGVNAAAAALTSALAASASLVIF
eukprot:CAMPEP_0197850036 /NCGR_PEP_ID=MMETSP1438-20131217/14058_1 /TAXON_ID=1461541 /ORGANISM="Pterosperma sp., Strain CCMP1384" /LENGTH=284 /DNA_ID=CAMNT_0043462985 /DNA_START=558 /DNA_END=1412 /DNA_ORIENTATION=+